MLLHKRRHKKEPSLYPLFIRSNAYNHSFNIYNNEGIIMSDNDKLVILYDYYGELFTEQQKRCFEGYYFENLSLSEIADIEDKSRNAIHKMIKSVCNKLYEYEDKLKMYESELKLREIIKKIDNLEIKKELEELL